MRAVSLLVACGLSLPFSILIACGGSDSRRHVVPLEAGSPETGAPNAGGKGGAGGGGTVGTGGTRPLRDASVDQNVPDARIATRDATLDRSTPRIDASLDGGSSVDAGPNYTRGIDAGPSCPGPVGELVITPESASLPSAGLVLWLRADRGMYKTAASEVCAWVDQSGRAAVFTPGPTRPTWNATGIGAQASVHFGPANSYVGTPGVLGLVPQQARTFVAVQRVTNTAARFQAINMGDFSTPGTYVMIDTNTFQSAGSREGVYVTNNSFDSDLATSTLTRLHVLSVDTMTIGTLVLPSVHYRVNGAERTLTRRLTASSNGNFQTFASANFTAIGTGTSTVDVAEVLAYDHVLTATELTALEAALTGRYAIN
jgi:hypothetical protein